MQTGFYNRLVLALPSVITGWVYRIIKRLPPDISHHTQKPKEKARMDSENLESLSLWFITSQRL